ncbi:MAG: hypothetical protein OEZ36_07240 [Spirochaetota bacterium]|nr:hypothetical protein [Spirochaetota bacterium]
MVLYANIYDLCDNIILKEKPGGEPGENLRLLYKKSVKNIFLKSFILKSCYHPQITDKELPKYQDMIRSAMQATYENWRDPLWIETTFKPLADLLDSVKNPQWQKRKPLKAEKENPSKEEITKIIDRTMLDIFRVWKRDEKDPYFPVAAQVILSGDDHMDGANLISVLKGLGAFEYQNITFLFYLVRCFIMNSPKKLKLIRKPFNGVAEPMYQRFMWIWHRIAFSDVNFFEHLLNYLKKYHVTPDDHTQIIAIMENLIRYIVVTSQEWLESPTNRIEHPATTCLPMDDQGNPLCRLSKSDWEKKKDLGFGDYVPDTDTTFLALSMAKKWVELVKEESLEVDKDLIEECESFLNHPWVEIITEYQIGSGFNTNPPTIEITKPLDYNGSVPIWFNKCFRKSDDRVIREAIGNEICPGHNMDIFESILINRKQWNALEGDNLAFLHRLLDFHHTAYKSGNFKEESALKYYLPEIYVFYTGRMYEVFQTLSPKEKKTLDPDDKIKEIREIAIEYCKTELLGHTINPFDASLAVSALVLLKYKSKQDGVIATGLKILSKSLGEGIKGHPYKAYEWNRMRHPTRILVGSEISTSFFVMNACVEAYHYLYSDKE